MFQILVVEDDKSTARLMKAVLRHGGYEVVEAGNGVEALATMDTQHIDLIVLDIMMPKMDGYELTERLRSCGNMVPILMVTAKQLPEEKCKGFLVGTDDYMVKPVNQEELLLRIKALLRRAQIANERKLRIGQVILDYDDLTQEERAECIQTIIEESSRLMALASNILNLSKIERQSILTERIWFNVSEQIRRVIALLDKKWSAKDITVVFDCGEHYIEGNEELLKQLWINLADNAVKFSPERETVEISIRETVETLTVSFANKSDEIPAAAQSYIFDKFYQADTSHATQGNGLGLAIVSKIVQLHHGTIDMRRSAANETVFEVALPRKGEFSRK